MGILRKLFLLALNGAIVFTSCSQQSTKPFYSEIQNFKSSDRQNPPPKDAIVFVGSSSFAMWTDVQKYFPGYKIINRGFGGSTLKDAIEYEDDIISPYHPKQVVIYSGENDIAANVTANDVLQRFTTLFNMIRKDLPDANIVYISIKPSPSRQKFMPVMVNANEMIKKFLAAHKNTVFVDVYSKMLDASGNPRGELFRQDSLHMKRAGYEIWTGALTPVLLK
jgi:lysophospholipase L1-like esterase